MNIFLSKINTLSVMTLCKALRSKNSVNRINWDLLYSTCEQQEEN